MIPPFENLTFSFLKNCTKVKGYIIYDKDWGFIGALDHQYGMISDLAIGTQINTWDVVWFEYFSWKSSLNIVKYENGRTKPEFSVEDFFDNQRIRIVGTEEDASVFYLFTDKRLILKGITVTTTEYYQILI